MVCIQLDGTFTKGAEILSSKEKKDVLDWVMSHKTALKKLYEYVKNGDEREKVLAEVKNTWEFEGHIFNGEKPRKEAQCGDAKVWYNGNLSEKKLPNGRTLIQSSNNMCVYYKNREQDSLRYMFKSETGDLQTN